MIKLSDNLKSMEELKEELGDKYDEIMYKANVEFIQKIDEVMELIHQIERTLRSDIYENNNN